MSKNQVIEYTGEVQKLTPIIKEQVELMKSFAESSKKAYASLPSDFQKQQREQLRLEQENEKLRQQSIKTQQQLEDLAKKQIQTAQANQRLQAQNRREAEAQERAIERQTKKVIDQSSAYLQLQRRWRESQRTLADLIVTQGKNAQATKQAQAEFDKLDTKLRSIDSAVKNYSRNVGNYKSALSGFSSLTSQLAGAFGWVGAVTTVASLSKSFYDTAKQLQTLNKTMELGSKDSEAYASNVSFLRKVTEDYGTEILTTTQAYNKFYIASKNKLALEEIQLIFDKISKSASLMGLSVRTQDLVFKALEQMMSKGTVQAEELRMQLGDHLPGAFEIMAKATGVSTAELTKMMQNGEVIASEVLPKFAIELEKAFGADQVSKVDNLTAAENRLKNSWTAFVEEVEGGEGVISRVMKNIYRLITDVVKGMEMLNKGREKLKEERKGNIGQQEMDFIENATNAYIKQREKRFQADKKAYTDEMKFAEAKEKKEELIAWKQQKNANRLNEIRERLRQLDIKRYSQNYDEIISLHQERERVEAGYNALAKMQLKTTQSVFIPKNTETVTETKTLTKEQQREAERAEKERLRLVEEVAKASAELKRRELQSDIENEKERSLMLSQNKGQQLLIEMNYHSRLFEVAELNRQENLRQAGDAQHKQLLAWQTYYEEVDKLMRSYNKAELDYQKEVDKQLSDSAKKAMEEAKKDFEARQKIREEEAKRIKQLAEETKNYLSKFTDIGQFGFSSLNIFTDIDEQGNTMFENLLKGAKEWKKQTAVIIGAVGEIAKDVMNAINQASQARFDAEMGRLQVEYETSLMFAGDSTEAKERLAEQYEEKQKELRKKQAKRDKEAAIMTALINTAQAVVGVLAQEPGGLIKRSIAAAIVGAMGMAQVAAIASTPIPEFWTGTDNAPEGLAWTQERGAEVITDKKGNVKTWGHSKGATLTYLNKGDKVYKSHEDYFKEQDEGFNNELNSILASNRISPIVVNNGVTKEEMSEVMQETLGKQPKYSTVIDEYGINAYWQTKDSRQKIKNRSARR